MRRHTKRILSQVDGLLKALHENSDAFFSQRPFLENQTAERRIHEETNEDIETRLIIQTMAETLSEALREDER